MKTATAIGLGLMIGFATTARSQETKANEFEGAYTITAGEQDGKPLPDEHVKGSTVRITGDSIVVADKEDKEIYVAKYVLDTKKTPATITMTETGGPRGRKGQKAIGIIEKGTDSLKLCYCYEGGIVPTSFKTKPGEKQLFFTLKSRDTK